MLNPDRSLPMVIAQSKYSIESQLAVVKRCIEDPFFFYNLIVKYNNGRKERK